MAGSQELQVQQKREVEKKPESTIPARVFLPVADIFETDQSLTVILEMPGDAIRHHKGGVEANAELADQRRSFFTLGGFYSIHERLGP